VPAEAALGTRIMRQNAGILLYGYRREKLHILLVFNGKNWGIPKGGIEPLESEREAAIRELKEETTIDAPDYLFEIGYAEKVGKSRLCCFAGCLIKRPQPKDGIVQAAYFKVEKALQIIQDYQKPLLDELIWQLEEFQTLKEA
jgi:8-oxo-dGTP pyrophosphatase MutT (NUDIX family)